MKLPIKDRLLSSFGVFALLVILVVLGLLQYRWSRELNDAASDRMRAGLHTSMMGLREDLNREFAGLSLALQVEPSAQGVSSQAEAYMEGLEAWRRTATHPGMVGSVYVWEDAAGKRSRLLRLNTTSRQFEPVQWPAGLGQLHDTLSSFSTELFEFITHVPGRPSPRGDHRSDRSSPRALPWAIEQAIPAVLHPQVVKTGGRNKNAILNWVIVQLDAGVVERSVLPDLAQKYFAGPEGLIYDVAVVSEGEKRGTVYSSNSQLGTSENVSVDGRMFLFGPPNGFVASSRVGGLPPRGAGQQVEHDWHGFGHGGPLRLEPFRRAGSQTAWVLLAKHRKGSLEAALASIRRRHMAVSFGVLLMLALTLGMIVAATRRAQRLAKLQMDFVAGVSHELRTPLAVISSAADNIASGIIDDKRKLARYGEVIRSQSRQLTHLVEQILLFAATREEKYLYSLAPVQPADIVRRAVANSAELIRAAGVTVEQHIDAGLPTVLVDLPAVSHCLQNLIVNAVKYGGESRWVRIRAGVSLHGTEREVRISVEDKGIGIEEAELQKIFDPFYRSPVVLGAQIHGTGLGLALAKGVAESMGGNLTVRSRPGEGSVFVLHLPCAPESVAAETALAAAVQSGISNQ